MKPADHYSNAIKITPFLMFSCVMAATGGLMYGYDLVIAGGVSIMSDFLERFYPTVYANKLHATASNYCKYDSQALQLFSSSLYLAALFATFFASAVTRKLGRTASMLVAGLFFIAGTVLGSGAQNIFMLICGRVLLGCGIGFSNQAVPLYLSEIARPSSRGGLSMLFSLNVVIGIFFGNVVNYFASSIHPWGWRLSLGLAGVPAILLTVASLILVETPTSLIQRGKHEKAQASLRILRATSDIDLEYQDLVEACKVHGNVTNSFGNLLKRRNTPQLVFAMAFPFFQQVGGNDAILFYGPFLFKTAGFQDNSALYSAVIIGGTALLSVSVGMMLVDRLGRRVLLLGGALLTGSAMVLLGIIFAVDLPKNSSPQLPRPTGFVDVALVCLFVIAFACSWGPLSWLIPSEIYPLDIRSAGQSVTVCVNTFFKFAIAQTFLSMLCAFKYGIFMFFAGWVVVMGLFAWLLVPETKGVPIDDMVELWEKHWYWKRFVEQEQNSEAFSPSMT